MKNIFEEIEIRRNDLINSDYDTLDIEFLDKFNCDIKSLSTCDFLDLITVFYMAKKEVGVEEADEAILPAKDILSFVHSAGDPEDVITLMNIFYDVINAYKDELNDYKPNDFLNLKSEEKIIEDLKCFLLALKSQHSDEEVEIFLEWMIDDDLSDVVAISSNLKVIEGSLLTKEIEGFSHGIISKRTENRIVKGANKAFLKKANNTCKKEIDALISYKIKKHNEYISFERNTNKQLKNLDMLEQDLKNKTLDLKKLEKYNLDSALLNLALIELIKQKNIDFEKIYETVENYSKDSINQLEIIFDKYGRNFNKLTKEEQELLANAYSLEVIDENLNFITTSSLNFLSEEDESFIKILTLEIDVLMKLDSLLRRNKISDEFILIYGAKLNPLIVKVLVHNVNKLDAQKINFNTLLSYDKDILLELNNKLLDMLVKYGINLSDVNLKHFAFLEDANLLNIIDKFIELGLLNQIQKLPNLISNSSEIILKRIQIMQLLEQSFINENNTLDQIVRSGRDFYLSDDIIDEYVCPNYQTFLSDHILNILNEKVKIELLETIPEELSFIEEYKKNEQVYIINGNYFSRIKVLRCLKTLIDAGFNDYQEILFASLIYNYPKYLSIDEIKELKNTLNIRQKLIIY